jgi:predicted nucleic acid-binding protein
VFLADTNVISEGAPAKAKASPALVRWMDRNSGRLFLSTITLAEIEQGIARARRLGAHAKAIRLATWLETLIHLYRARMLPLDVRSARIAGSLSDLARSRGHAPGFPDLAIAATAVAYNLTILTGNVRDFAPLGVPVLNPFETLP